MQSASVIVAVEPAGLEDLLECLARIRVPIDPHIQHGDKTVVEFEAPRPELSYIQRVLRMAGYRSTSKSAA